MAMLVLLVASVILLFAGPMPAGPAVDGRGCVGTHAIAAMTTSEAQETPQASGTVLDGLDPSVADTGILADLGLLRASEAIASVRPVVSASYAELPYETRTDSLRAPLHRPPRAA